MDEHGCREKVIKQFRTVRIVIELDCGNTYINSIILPMFDEVTPKVWTKNIRLYGNEYGTQPGSFLLI